MRKAALILSVAALLFGAAQANAGSGKLAQVNVAPTDAADASSSAAGRSEAGDAAAPEADAEAATEAAAPAVPTSRKSRRTRGYDEDEAYARAEAAEYARQARAEAYRAKLGAYGLPDCDVVRGYARSFSGYYE